MLSHYVKHYILQKLHCAWKVAAEREVIAQQQLFDCSFTVLFKMRKFQHLCSGML